MTDCSNTTCSTTHMVLSIKSGKNHIRTSFGAKISTSTRIVPLYDVEKPVLKQVLMARNEGVTLLTDLRRRDLITNLESDRNDGKVWFIGSTVDAIKYGLRQYVIPALKAASSTIPHMGGHQYDDIPDDEINKVVERAK